MAVAGGQKRPGLVLPRRNRRYRFSMTPLADALLAQGTRDVLVVLRRDVAVQQLVTVLQTLAARGITSVQIAGGGT